jgi:hypothetical protein
MSLKQFALAISAALAGGLLSGTALPAEPAPPTPPPTSPPDESILGTLDVNGAAAAAPLPKLAVMPVVTTGDADTTLQLVVKKDLDLCGQFDVVDDSAGPSGLFLHDCPSSRRLAHRESPSGSGPREQASSGKISCSAALTSNRGQDPVFQHRIETDAPWCARRQPHDRRARRPHRAPRRIWAPADGRCRQVFGIDAACTRRDRDLDKGQLGRIEDNQTAAARVR